MRCRFFGTIAAILAVTLGGCAGGRPRMLGTSAESARDATRLRAMIVDCVAGAAARGDVEPLSLTPEQTAQATLVYYWFTYESVIDPQQSRSLGDQREGKIQQVT